MPSTRPAAYTGLDVPFQPSTPVGEQAAYLIASSSYYLFEDSYAERLRELQAQVASAAAQHNTVTSSSSSSDLESIIQQRVRQLRRGQAWLACEELVYLWCVSKLQCTGFCLTADLSEVDPSSLAFAASEARQLATLHGAGGMRRLAASGLLELAVLDAVQGLVASTLDTSTSATSSGATSGPGPAASSPGKGSSQGASSSSSSGVGGSGAEPPGGNSQGGAQGGGWYGGQPMENLVASVDRVQAARLYAGCIEYGYSSQGLAGWCSASGRQLGREADVLVDAAADMPTDQLRRLAHVGTWEAWRAAVRHTGLLFKLPPPDDDPHGPAAGPGTGAPSWQGEGRLPYPQLDSVSTTLQVLPSDYIPEMYAKPSSLAGGTGEGWAGALFGGDGGGAALPAADFVTLRMDVLRCLLLEAAVLGCLLWLAEDAAGRGGVSLTQRAVLQDL